MTRISVRWLGRIFLDVRSMFYKSHQILKMASHFYRSVSRCFEELNLEWRVVELTRLSTDDMKSNKITTSKCAADAHVKLDAFIQVTPLQLFAPLNNDYNWLCFTFQSLLT